MLTRRPPAPPMPRVAVAAAGLPAGIVAALVASAAGGSPVTGTVCAAAAALVIGLRAPPSGAAGAAVLCWAFADGFVLHRYGELHAGVADVLALAVVLGAGVTGCALAVTARTVRAGRSGYARPRAGRGPAPDAVVIGRRMAGSP